MIDCSSIKDWIYVYDVIESLIELFAQFVLNLCGLGMIRQLLTLNILDFNTALKNDT